jgi:hypothetical protein
MREPIFDFNTFEEFEGLASIINDRVCENAPVTTPPQPPEVVRLFRSMPNAKVTFDQFWLSRVQRTVLVRFLRDALGDPSITCPPP